MGERRKKLTFLDYYAGSRDLMSFSVYRWLEYYDKEAYEQTLDSGKAVILDFVEDVASELDNTGESHLAETTRAGGLFVYLSAFAEEQKRFGTNMYDLDMYKNFLGTVLKTMNEKGSAKDSLIIAQGVLQDRFDEIIERWLPDKN